MANIDLGADVRGRVEQDVAKRDPHDFVLWFSRSKFPNQIMQWDSPWGRGFPGWHIECSAMAVEYLGERADIHMGGIDHIPVHHTNEIAQSEAALGHPWVRYWLHCNFLVVKKKREDEEDEAGVETKKMAKAEGDFLRLAVVEGRGYQPVHFRYFCLGSHYRAELAFSWESLDNARRAFETFKNLVVGWKIETAKLGKAAAPSEATIAPYRERFRAALHEDINTAKALTVMWEMARDPGLRPPDRLALAREMDAVFNLGVDSFRRPEIPDEVRTRIRDREQARAAKQWNDADAIRDELATRGYQLMDTADGTDWYQIT
jgi:cysteinyl-tRNA synthetase